MWLTNSQKTDRVRQWSKKNHQIHVLDTGTRFFCAEDEFVLEAMKRERSGPIHYGCFGGGCGICRMKIVSGRYCIAKKMSRAHVTEREQGEGIVLICCVQPRGDLTIARINKDNK